MSAGVLPVEVGAPGVRAAFTTRAGGASTGPYASLNLGSAVGDDPGAVRANRAAVADALGFDPRRAVTMRQVHGAHVVQVGPGGGDGAFTGSLDGVADADACVTTAPGVALLAMGADCPVIVAWRGDGAGVAAIHAGWRGLEAGVVEAGIAALGECPEGVHAVVGPHVGPCCYPVDADLRHRMAVRFGAQAVRGGAVDLGACAAVALERAGVPGHRRGGVHACTSCDGDRFFSYRRDGAATGRQAAVVVMGDGA